MTGLFIDPFLWITIGLILIVITFLFFWFRRSHDPIGRKILAAVFMIYLATIVRFTLIPAPYEGSLGPGLQLGEYYQFLPFYTIVESFQQGTWLSVVAGQIGLYLLLPIFFGILVSDDIHFIWAFAIGTLLSFSIQLMVFGINLIIGYPTRVADIDSLILNTIGAMIGYAIFKYYRRMRRRQDKPVLPDAIAPKGRSAKSQKL